MALSPYESEGLIPLFPTPNEALHFMKDSVARGLLRPCAHLRVATTEALFSMPSRYAPACELNSFKIEAIPYSRDRYNFYGCPPNCLLFAEDSRATPWAPAMNQPLNSTGNPENKGPSVSVKVKVAWIGVIGSICAALVMGSLQLLKSEGQKPGSAEPRHSESIQQALNQASRGAKVVQGAETQQNQSVQQSPGSTNIQAGQVGSLVVNPPPATPAPPPVGWAFTDTNATALKRALLPGAGRRITIKNNVADPDADGLADRLERILAQAGWKVERSTFLAGASIVGLKITATNGVIGSALQAALKAGGLTDISLLHDSLRASEYLELEVGRKRTTGPEDPVISFASSKVVKNPQTREITVVVTLHNTSPTRTEVTLSGRSFFNGSVLLPLHPETTIAFNSRDKYDVTLSASLSPEDYADFLSGRGVLSVLVKARYGSPGKFEEYTLEATVSSTDVLNVRGSRWASIPG